MATAELHFFDADDPNGSTIFECSTDDEFVKQIELDIQRDSLGNGLVNFARKVPIGLFSRDIVEPEVLVRVLIPAVHATKYYSGFWINPRQQQVVSLDEKGGEGFTFGGPGPKHYLTRSLLWSASFSGIPSAVDKDAGIWTWPETAVAGRILERIFQEDAANPSGPFLPDLTLSFDENDDSNGDPWTENISDGNDDFTLRIQDDLLKILWKIEDASGITSQIYLGEVGTPLIRLDAFQTFGRDLTDDVAFVEGHNIRDDLEVEGSSYRKASHALVKGNDGHYELAIKPSWSPGDLKKVMPVQYESDSAGILDNAGVRALQRQDNGEKQIDLCIVTGFSAAQGRYFPGPDYSGSNGDFWVGDSVSLTTGQAAPTELDYQDETQVVTGISLELGEAVRDDNDERRARSFDVTIHLNEERKSSNSSVDLAGNRGTVLQPANPLRLCKPGVFDSFDFLGLVSAACSNSGANFNSDFPAWAGDKEERVQITAPRDIPVGHALIAVTGIQKVYGALDDTVYDEQGNTWTKDAEHENTASSTDDTVQIWRCNVTTQLDAGDYIRWALNVGGSGDPTSEAGGRCIGVSEFSSTLTVDTVGTGAGSFSASPAITVPSGELVVAGICQMSQTGAGDAGFEAMIPQTEVAGSGFNASSVFAQYQSDFTTSGWNPPTDAVGDYAAIAVAYDVAAGETIINDGNPDLVGTSKRVARCDHRHDVFRDAAPTVNDDWETQGYKVGTLWLQLDDLVTPGAINAAFILLDDSTGAAIWSALPAGGGGGGSGATVVGHADDIGASPLIVAAPGGIAAGDLIVFAVNTVNSIPNAAGPTTPATGWNQLLRFDTSSNEFHAVYWRIADGTETDFRITHGAGSEACAIAVVYRGVDTHWSDGYNIDSYVSPSIIGHENGLLVLVFFASGAGGSDITAPGHVTQDEFVQSATANKAQLMICHRDTFAEDGVAQFVATSTASAAFAGALAVVFHD